MGCFKIDMHVHTAEVSPCGKVAAAEVVRLYKEAGYDGIVITDHYYDGFFEEFQGLPWEEQIEHYLAGYREALRVGRRIGLQVILGMELRFTENANDYLVYGIDEDFLRSLPRLFEYNLTQLQHFKKDQDILIYQAHPFRRGIVAADPLLLDGIEVFNGNPRHDSRNDLAHQYALQNNLKMISGSDFHQKEDLARGGIGIPEKAATPAELVNILKQDRDIEISGGDPGVVGLRRVALCEYP